MRAYNPIAERTCNSLSNKGEDRQWKNPVNVYFAVKPGAMNGKEKRPTFKSMRVLTKIIEIMGQMGEQPRRGCTIQYPRERVIRYLTRGRTGNGRTQRTCISQTNQEPGMAR